MTETGTCQENVEEVRKYRNFQRPWKGGNVMETFHFILFMDRFSLSFIDYCTYIQSLMNSYLYMSSIWFICFLMLPYHV
jgi:hypothetical protein